MLLASPDRVSVPLEDFARAIDQRTALVATCRVYFTSGYIQDVQALAQMAHAQGALLLVDDYQGTGQLPGQTGKSRSFIPFLIVAVIAGAIGYRSLAMSGVRDGDALGLTGFGGSAHLVVPGLHRMDADGTHVEQLTRSPVPEEALKTVPKSYREGSLALGATKWQAIRTNVLPYALPGMLTGTVLGLARAAGETAPIMFTGAAFSLPFLPHSIKDQFMALPYHLYIMATQHHDLAKARPLAYGTALVLLILVLGMNTGVAVVRYRLRRKRRA